MRFKRTLANFAFFSIHQSEEIVCASPIPVGL